MDNWISITALVVSTLSTVIAAVWVISQKLSLRRTDVDSIVNPIVERLDKLTTELTTLAKESVQRDELQSEINRLRDDIKEEKKERIEEVQGVRTKIVNHLTEHQGIHHG